MIPQRTVCRAAEMNGIALHTGNRVSMRLEPAPVGTGIEFVRVDLDPPVSIPARIGHVVGVTRGTTIQCNGAAVHTVEHLLAALTAFGVNNARIHLTASEPPVGDGSSAPFLELLEQAGVEDQPGVQDLFVVEEPVCLDHGGSIMVALPRASGFFVSCTIAFDTPALRGQFLGLDISPRNFARELARARTFCLYEELEPLMRAGLIQGGSLENAVVIRQNAIFCREGLRYPDEFVRHKILDIIGDLALLGRPIQGHILAVKPGHSSNVNLARALVDAERTWREWAHRT